jgi:hypothetical protein
MTLRLLGESVTRKTLCIVSRGFAGQRLVRIVARDAGNAGVAILSPTAAVL